jgi:hypothetical protein
MNSSNDHSFGGSTVTILSQKGFGLDLAWHVSYDDRFSFFGFGSYNYFSFSNDPNYSLNHLNLTNLHFGLGGGFFYSPELKFTSIFSLREVSFLDVITPTVVSLETISVPEIGVGFEKTLFAKKDLFGIWGAHLLGLFPSINGSYKSKLGYGIRTKFELSHKNKSLFLSYELRSVGINEIKNNESSIFFGINLLE